MLLSVWRPWTDVGGRRVVGDWQVPEGGTVLVGVDVYEPDDGRPIYDVRGDVVACGVTKMTHMTAGGCDFESTTGLVRKIFAEIDSRSATRFVLPTRWVERLRFDMPRFTCPDCRGGDLGKLGAAPCPSCRGTGHGVRPNLIPAALIRTQRDAERMLPVAEYKARADDDFGFVIDQTKHAEVAPIK